MFAIKYKHSAPAARRSRLSRFGYRGPEVKTQQAEIRRILRSTGAQYKLTIGQPDDKYEQEADRVADQVMRMPDPKLQRQPENEEEEEMLQAKPLADQITPLIQRQAEPEEEEEELVQPGYDQEPEDLTPILESVPTRDAGELGEEEAVQTKSLANKPAPVTAGLQSRIHSLEGGGQALPGSERAFFEPRFGADFSAVKIHTGAGSESLARGINAKAFTLGRNIIFAAGQYAPETGEGRKLLAHELTHTIQQGNATEWTIRRDVTKSSTSWRKRCIANGWTDWYLADISHFNPDPRFINNVRKKWLRILNSYRVGYITDYKFLTLSDMQHIGSGVYSVTDFKTWIKYMIRKTWKNGDNPKSLAKDLNKLDDHLNARKRLVKRMSSPVGFMGKTAILEFHSERYENDNSFLKAGCWAYKYFFWRFSDPPC